MELRARRATSSSSLPRRPAQTYLVGERSEKKRIVRRNILRAGTMELGTSGGRKFCLSSFSRLPLGHKTRIRFFDPNFPPPLLSCFSMVQFLHIPVPPSLMTSFFARALTKRKYFPMARKTRLQGPQGNMEVSKSVPSRIYFLIRPWSFLQSSTGIVFLCR